MMMMMMMKFRKSSAVWVTSAVERPNSLPCHVAGRYSWITSEDVDYGLKHQVGHSIIVVLENCEAKGPIMAIIFVQ